MHRYPQILRTNRAGLKKDKLGGTGGQSGGMNIPRPHQQRFRAIPLSYNNDIMAER